MDGASLPPHKAAALKKQSERQRVERVANKVFQITELAEKIFLFLPPRDILVNVQRVSRRFKAVIDGSELAQQALFNKPIGNIQLQRVACYKRSTCNGFWELSTEQNAYCRDVATGQYCFMTHPLVRQIQEDNVGLEKRARYRNASWRRQLAFQPPVSYVLVLDCQSDEYEVHGGELGITVEQIAECFTKAVREEEAYFDGLTWRDSEAWLDKPAIELLEEIQDGIKANQPTALQSWCTNGTHRHQ
ncbi:putative F-box domain-containing protein [Septoria linicola]|nr:putative F-box domain-containing protein [Septoria linicola]